MLVVKKSGAKLIAIFALVLFCYSVSWGADKEAWYCAGYVRIMIGKLPDTVAAQRKATTLVPIEKTIPGDLIFFGEIGKRWGCPNGFSGLVTHVEKGFILFVVGTTEPKSQVLLFPTKTYKGNEWYQFRPEIRTFEPHTDPPRPGDKNYKPKDEAQ